MKIKRILTLLIVISMLPFNVVFGSSVSDGYTINYDVSLFDDYTTLHSMTFKINEDKVYASVTELSEVFGYDCDISVDTNSIYISNKANLFFMLFHSDSKNIEYMLGAASVLNYTAPFEAIIENEQTAWVPFEYFLYLADSSYIIVEDKIHIETPKITAVKLLKQMAAFGIDEYAFDIFEELGHEDLSFYIQGGASHLINYLNGILEFDPASWGLTITQFGDLNSYDAKYGNTLSTMFCTSSQEELREYIDVVEGISGSTDNLIMHMKSLDFEIGQLNRTCELMLNRLEGTNPPTATYNKLYQQLENALSNQKALSSFVDPVISVKENLLSDEKLNMISYGLQGFTYTNEFDKQDSFALDALRKFINQIPDDSYMSSTTKNALHKGAIAFEKDKLSFAISNVISDNWLEFVVSKTELDDKLLGPQGAAIKFVWDLSSSFVPFISQGLSDADNFELSCYALLLQSDAMLIYQTDRDKCLWGDFSNSKDIEDSLYSAYTFLKSCLIAREAGIASVSKMHSKVPEYIELLENKNTRIEKDLAQIKYIISSQDKRMLGFTPDIANEYLDKYDDSFLVDLLKDESIHYEIKVETGWGFNYEQDVLYVFEYPFFTGESNLVSKLNSMYNILRRETKQSVGVVSTTEYSKTKEYYTYEDYIADLASDKTDCYIDIVTCNISYEQNNIISISQQENWYMGGVFDKIYHNHNFNVATGDELQITDVMYGSKKEIVDYLQKEFVLQYGELFDDFIELEYEEVNYFLTDEGVNYIPGNIFGYQRSSILTIPFTRSDLIKAPYMREVPSFDLNTESHTDLQSVSRDVSLIQYLGMTIDDIAEIFGKDFTLTDYMLGGGARGIYYSDGRIPFVFYFYDNVENLANPDTVYTGEEIVEIIEYVISRNTENKIYKITETLSSLTTYEQLKEDYKDTLYENEMQGGFSFDLEVENDIHVSLRWEDYPSGNAPIEIYISR